MFNAMRYGKAGRTAQDLPAGTAMRDLFRRTEDMLTGTVFERLGYLPGSETWSLLRGTFKGLPDRRVVEIIDVEFWPSMETDDDSRSFVEPDVMLTLDLGDPPRRTLLLVEAKTGGTQSRSQWEDQLRALRLRLEDRDNTEVVFYAALGGLNGRDADKTWHAIPPDLGERVRFVHGDWTDLASAIAYRAPSSPEADRVVGDIKEALAFHGYVALRLSEAMFEIDRPLDVGKAMKTLMMGETV